MGEISWTLPVEPREACLPSSIVDNAKTNVSGLAAAQMKPDHRMLTRW